MDYRSASASFKLRKAARYTRLYGIQRTAIKVKSQWHMNRAYTGSPVIALPVPAQHVGLIGCGKFGYSTIAYYLQRELGPVLRHVMDIDLGRAASLARDFAVPRYGTSAEELLDDDHIDLVYIASNHASHSDYAVEALRRGKHVHIEKPHVVSSQQLAELVDAMRTSPGKVELGFNRPDSQLGIMIANALRDQSGSMMLNWFVAGHELPADHWYYAPEEGGRVLGNLCHWTDFVFNLVPEDRRFPIDIVPTRARQSDCDICVSYVFGDESIATITFSAKGHAFEGVKESFSAHRGDVLLELRDFQTLTVQNGAKRTTTRKWFRDHGHRNAILRSYRMAQPSACTGTVSCGGRSPEYVRDTALLFLQTKAALDERRTVHLTKPHTS